jgi:hypothetical protein
VDKIPLGDFVIIVFISCILCWCLFYKFKFIVVFECINLIIKYSIGISLFGFELPCLSNEKNSPKDINRKSFWIDNLSKRFLKDVLFSNRISYEDVQIKIIAGSTDVMLTSIGYGFGSILLSIMPVLIKGFLKPKTVSIRLRPVFKKNVFQISIKCIVRVKIVNIIIILFGEKIKRWWNIWRIRLMS